MYRVALQYDPPLDAGPLTFRGAWHVVKCWNVHDDWASRAVDIDRRTPKRKKLRLLTPWRLEIGRVINPREILEGTLAVQRMRREAAQLYA